MCLHIALFVTLRDKKYARSSRLDILISFSSDSGRQQLDLRGSPCSTGLRFYTAVHKMKKRIFDGKTEEQRRRLKWRLHASLLFVLRNRNFQLDLSIDFKKDQRTPFWNKSKQPG
jgi:hypothetical protein